MIGWNAASAFRGTSANVIVKALTMVGAFAIADMTADKVDKHISNQYDEWAKYISDLYHSIKEEDPNETIIDTTARESGTGE
jgi:hypothetical protein